MDTKNTKQRKKTLKTLTLATIALIAETLSKQLAQTQKLPYTILKTENIIANGTTFSSFASNENNNELIFVILPQNTKIQNYEVTLKNSYNNKILKIFNCSGFSDTVCPVDVEYPSLEYTISVQNLNNFTAENFTILKSEYFPYLIEDHTQFNTDGVTKGIFKIGVSFENLGEILPLNFNKDDYRIKFSIEKNTLSEGRENVQNLRMKVLGQDIEETASLVAEDLLSMDTGLVKTHTRSKKCPEKGCVYFVSVEFSKIKNLNFFTTIQKYEMLVKFIDSTVITDEVAPEKNLIFQFEKKDVSNWEFILVPLKGNPDLFINTSTKNPQNNEELERYSWISKQVQNQERIIITKQECAKKNSDCKGFYAVVKTTNTTSTFSLIVKSSTNDNPQYFLDLNIPFTGRVEEGEIVQFLVDLNPVIPETLRANIELTKVSGSGNPDLYIKDCGDVIGCTITQKDIINKEIFANFKKQYFAYSDNEESYDKIYLEMNIKPKNNDFVFENSHYTSKFNKLAVAVKGNKNESAFMLNFRAKSPHIRLQEEDHQKVSIIQGQKKYFVFNTFRPLDQINSLLFRFKLYEGEVKIYLSRLNKFPSESSYEETLKLTPDLDFRADYNPTINISRTLNNNNEIQGEYYLTAVAEKSSFLSIETAYEDKNSSRYESMKLRPGQTINRKILKKSDFLRKNSFDEFRFSVDSSENKEEEYTIKISNIVGRVKMCVEARYTDFDSVENCTDYESLLSNEVYSIVSTDSRLWNCKEVHVKVYPVNDTSRVLDSRNLRLNYEIQLARVGDINDVYFGSSHYGVLKKDKPQFFRISFSFDYFIRFASISFQAYQSDPKVKAKIQLQATLDPKNERVKESQNVLTSISDSGNVVFSLKQLRKYCSPSFDGSGIIQNDTYGDGTRRNRNLQYGQFGFIDYNSYRNNNRSNTTNPDYDLNTTVTPAKYYSDLCTIHVKLTNFNTDLIKYRLTPLMEGTFINLNNGTLDFFPAPSHEVSIYTYDLTNQKEDISVNFYTDYHPLHIKIELFDYNQYISNPYDTKALIITGRGQISLEVAEFAKKSPSSPYVMITVTDPERLKEKYYEPYNTDYSLGIKVSSRMELLLPHELSHKKGFKGTFSYFIVEADTDQPLLVSLNVDGEGDADLYINPGRYNYTSSEVYYKKSTGISDDEITLNVEDHQKNFEKKGEELPKQVFYTVGVYVYKNCEYDIIAMKGKRIIRSFNGDKFSLRTSLENPIIFELGNSYYRKTIDFVYWSDETLVSMFESHYSMDNDLIDEKSGEYKNELFEKIPTPNKFELQDSTLKIGEPKRYRIETIEKCDHCNFLVSLYPKDLMTNSSLVHFMRFSNYSTINLKYGEVVKHVLYKGEKQEFRFVGDFDLRNLKVSVILKTGKLELSHTIYGARGASAKTEKRTFEARKGGYHSEENFVLSGMDINSNLHKKMYFTLTAKEDSEFEIQASSNDRVGYIKLIPGTLRSYGLRKSKFRTNEHGFYFRHKENSGIKNATIEIMNSQIDISKVVITRNTNLTQKGGEVLKINKDYFVDVFSQNPKIHLSLEDKGGFYIVSFVYPEREIKIRLSFNNFKSLFIDSKETIRLKRGESHVYQIGIPESGVWRYSFLSCETGFRIYANLENEPIFTDSNLLEKETKNSLGEIKKSSYIDGSKTSAIFLKIVYDGNTTAITNDLNGKTTGDNTTLLFNSYFDSFKSKFYNSEIEIEEQVSNSSFFYDGFSKRTNELFFQVEYPTIASTLLRRYPEAQRVFLKFKYVLKRAILFNNNPIGNFNQLNPILNIGFFNNPIYNYNNTQFCYDTSLLELQSNDVTIEYMLSASKTRFIPVYISYSGGAKTRITNKKNGTENNALFWERSYFVDRIGTTGVEKFNDSLYYQVIMNRKLVIEENDLEVGEYILRPRKVMFTPNSYYRKNENTTGGYFNSGNGNEGSFWKNLLVGLLYGMMIGGVLSCILWAFIRCKDEVSARRALRGEFKREREVRYEEGGSREESAVTGIEMI